MSLCPSGPSRPTCSTLRQNSSSSSMPKSSTKWTDRELLHLLSGGSTNWLYTAPEFPQLVRSSTRYLVASTGAGGKPST
eukprot:9489481-Pyramimonas_sp.AAC.1